VKGATKHQILAAFEQRLNNSSRTEFKTAIEQVCHIITFRLEAGITA
jgi:2-oxo-4-hydroxy-4-carboxy-5-ureidoimidazoline decarboxylase